MLINRREFLLLTAGLAAGCKTMDDASGSATGHESTVNAGSASKYASDGVYSDFRDQGFFVISRHGKIFAISSICTHRKCKLNAESDHSFYCKCHGSTFDPDGHVTDGPARRDLPVLSTVTDQNGQLLVTVPRW
jgi:cytochrome b6-f complex iron-sulfur subunit